MNVYGLTFSFQSPSMLSLRGPEMEERADRLPPIRQDLVLVTIISIILINTKFPRNISAISKPNVSYIINTWKARECILFLEGSLLEWKRPGGGGLAAQQACYDTETSISWSFYFHICGKILKDFPFPQCKRFGLDIFCKFPRSRRMGVEIYCLERECSILVSAKVYYHVHFLEVT